MADTKSPSKTTVLDVFLDQYLPATALSLSAHEQAIVRSALEDFILDEWWLQRSIAYEAAKQAFAKLKHEAGEQSRLRGHIAFAERACEEMAVSLERFESALSIQREHCMMLSETARLNRKLESSK